MPRVKKTRRKYNPKKGESRLMLQKARNAMLYQWLSLGHPINRYEASGPYAQELTDTLMNWAMRQSIAWTCVIVSCFVTDAGDYYEEMATITKTDPLNISKMSEEFVDLIKQSVAMTKNSGNQEHYRDTLIVLRPYSTKFERNLEDDVWLNTMSGSRADIILDKEALAS